MKKFIINLSIFFVVLIAVDVCFGFISNYLIKHAAGGEIQKTEYICNGTSEDLLIMGSSRAVRHYDPKIISDSLGVSCYNCAYIGCGCITAYGLLQALTSHYSPKYILYEVTPEFDYLKVEEDYSKYLGPLKLYSSVRGVDSIFSSIDPMEKYKMNSNMYRINSKLLQLVAENITKQNFISNGYLPECRLMATEPDDEVTKRYNCNDDYKVKCFNNIIQLCKRDKIKLVFIVSPLYNAEKSSEFDYCKELAHKYNIPFINHFNDSTINRNKDYFYDPVHMNVVGANAYTRNIIPELRAVFN